MPTIPARARCSSNNGHNSANDHDRDGCHDTEEDTDDDNDGVIDLDDDCQRGWYNWTATPPPITTVMVAKTAVRMQMMTMTA